jgi:hypothetical protein
MLQRQEANSRFLTECYLFPAALWSGPCPKIRRIDFSAVAVSAAGRKDRRLSQENAVVTMN